MEIPNADCHTSVNKLGYIQKQYGRTFPYLSHWRRRFCVLAKGRLYVYERDTSKGHEKTNTVIDLKFFDIVTEASQKDAKRSSNVFVLSTDEKLAEPGKHLFAAESASERQDWIKKIQQATELSKNNNKLPTPVKTNESSPQKAIPQEPPVKKLEDEKIEVRSSNKDEVKKVKEAPSNLKEVCVDVVDAISKKVAQKSPDKELQKDKKDPNTEEVPNGSKLSLKNKVHPDLPMSLGDGVPQSQPQLESITKYRIRGPAGRRAPQTRPSCLIKQRASSMSALQQEVEAADEDKRNRNSQALDNNPDEMFVNSMRPTSLNSSHPVLAYDYSSDEDSPEREISSLEQDIPEAQNEVCNPPPPIPPRRIGVNGVPVGPPVSRISTNHKTQNKLNLVSTGMNIQDVLEYRSLPRSLRKNVNIKHTSQDQKMLSSGISDPHLLATMEDVSEMEALDNLFMNRSLQSGNRNIEVISKPELDGSDTSTCKAEDNIRSCEERLSKALEDLSSLLVHLQHHTAELDLRTKRIESDTSDTKKDLTYVKDSTEHLRRDVDKLTESVSHITQEMTQSKIEHIHHRQEMEAIKKQCSGIIQDSLKAKALLEKSKVNYENTTKELKEMMKALKLTLESKEQEAKVRMSLAESGRSLSESDSRSAFEKIPEPVSVSKTVPHQKMYHSFFQKPSNFISNLTTSLTQGKFPGAKKETERRENVRDSKEIKYNDTDTKKEHLVEVSDETRSNSNRLRNGEHDSQVDNINGSNEKKLKSRRKRDTQSRRPGSHSGSKRSLIGFSNENLPMMDEDESLSELEKKNEEYRMYDTHFNAENHFHHKFRIKKSSSSPSVPEHVPKINTQAYNLPQMESANGMQIPSPILPHRKGYINAIDTNPSYMRTQRPISGSSIDENSSVTSYPEEPIPFPRQRIYAITKQKSSPNIPLQRQSSGTMFPLMKQHSLGTVPEEGVPRADSYQLLRQDSLMSVPEDRPITDRTLPLSPSASMISFGLSPSPSGDRLNNALRERSSLRNSMELLTGPVVAGSSLQESLIREMPPFPGFETAEGPLATSSIKRRKPKTFN